MPISHQDNEYKTNLLVWILGRIRVAKNMMDVIISLCLPLTSFIPKSSNAASGCLVAGI